MAERTGTKAFAARRGRGARRPGETARGACRRLTARVLGGSGNWAGQGALQGPPVFVPKFVQTHARVYLGDSGINVELWEQPKPALQSLRVVERLAILGRLPAQPA
jgi:hypothetical protein